MSNWTFDVFAKAGCSPLTLTWLLERLKARPVWVGNNKSLLNSNQQALTDEPAWEAESATVISEVVEELTEEELEDQQRLELKVERSFTGAAMHCWNCETGACTAVHIEPLKHIVRIDLLWDGITPID